MAVVLKNHALMIIIKNVLKSAMLLGLGMGVITGRGRVLIMNKNYGLKVLLGVYLFLGVLWLFRVPSNNFRFIQPSWTFEQTFWYSAGTIYMSLIFHVLALVFALNIPALKILGRLCYFQLILGIVSAMFIHKEMIFNTFVVVFFISFIYQLFLFTKEYWGQSD